MKQNELIIFNNRDGIPERLTEIGGKLYVTTPGRYNSLRTMEQYMESNEISTRDISVLCTEPNVSAHLVLEMFCRSLSEWGDAFEKTFQRRFHFLEDMGIDMSDDDDLLRLKVEVEKRASGKYEIFISDVTTPTEYLLYASHNWEDKHDATSYARRIADFARDYLFDKVEIEWDIAKD